MQVSPGMSVDEAHADGIWSVAWSDVDNTIVTGSVDDLVKTWSCEVASDGVGGKISSKQNLAGHQLGVVSVVTNTTGSVVASSGLDSHINIWSIQGTLLKSIDAGPVECWTVALSPDDRHVASGTQGGNINIWSLDTGELEACLETKGKFVMSVAYSTNGQTLACGANDGAIYVFDVASGSNFILSGSDDKRVNLYDPGSKNPKLASLPGHDSWVLSVAHNPTQEQFATSSSDKTVKIWDARARECIHTFRDLHKDQVWDVAYKPDGSQLVSVSDDRSLICYDINSF